MPARRNWKTFFSTQRHVNLIYFVDAAKTKTFRISMRSASCLVIASALVIIWAVASGVLLLRTQAKQSDLRTELSLSRSVIFEYQTLYDGVFEQAYPELRERRYSGLTPIPAKSVAIAAQAANPGNATQIGVPVITDTPEKAKIISREDAKAPVSLSNPSIIRRASSFEVFFDLRNSDPSSKAEGFIWAIAAMEKQNGEQMTVTVPKALTVSAAGELLNPEHGQRFGIRRFARRSFVFALPQQFDGRVLTVDIAFSGQRAKYQSSYTIPINMRFSHLASNKATQEKKAAKENKPLPSVAEPDGEAPSSADDEG